MPKFDVILISQWGVGEAREVPGKVQIEAVDAIDALDRLFHAQQDDRKPFPWLSSMSAGDVAVVDGKPWYCRACGWLEITTGEFLSWLRTDRRDRGLGWHPEKGDDIRGMEELAKFVHDAREGRIQ